MSGATVWVYCRWIEPSCKPWAAGPPAFAMARVREARGYPRVSVGVRWADQWPGWCRAFGDTGPWPLVPARTLPLP